MSAAQVADEFDRALADDGYGFAVVNLANPDMVGHTGSIPAAVKAVEAADAALGSILAAVEREGGVALVTADHGNAEEMLDAEGNPQTAHTSNPVPLVVTDARCFLREDGELSDLMPTAISLLGLAKPLQMSGHNLLEESRNSGLYSRTFRMPLTQPDPGVLRKAQRGDERAFTLIVRAYETPVYNYVLRLVGGDRVARRGSDAGGLPPRLPGAPEVLAPLEVHDLALPGDEEPRARRAARERAPAAPDASRSRTSRRSRSSTRRSSASRRWTPSGARSESLTADLKMALLLRDVVGLSYTEIADSLEITLATVKWRIYKAREEVQLALAREGITFGERAEGRAVAAARGSAPGQSRRRAQPLRERPRAARAPVISACVRAMSYDDAVEARAPRLEVELEPRRPRVAVARLADRARVQEPAAARRARPRSRRARARRSRSPSASESASATWLCPTSTSGATVSSSASQRGLLGDHVLPDRVARACVEELGALGLRLGREALEEGAVLVQQHRPRPASGRSRVGAELVQVEPPEDAQVVVADEAERARSRMSVDHLVRARPVADEVAQAPELVRRVGVDRLEDGLERV